MCNLLVRNELRLVRESLAEGSWDAVLSDFSLPGFSAAEALALCRDTDPDLPFIVVSGTIGEQQAVEMMRVGPGITCSRAT